MKIVGYINGEILLNKEVMPMIGRRTVKCEKIPINGYIKKIERTTSNYRHRTITTLTIVEDTGFGNHLMARCKPIPYQNEFENEKQKLKEKDTMTVKIKKQPKEITLEELKQADEFEKVIIHIDNEKKEEIEEKYGVKYGISNKTWFTNEELEFKEHYLRSSDDYTIPYEIITKIEVVEN